MPQNLIGCWNQRKLKGLIPRVVDVTNDRPSTERRIDFAVFYFIVLWSYSRKIYLNMCYGNSDAYSCLLRICFIYGTINVSVSQSWISLLSCSWPRTMCFLIYQQTSANQNTVHLENGLIWKFSREWLLWSVCSSEGSLRKKSQSPLWSVRPKISHRCSRSFCRHYDKR